MKQVKMFFSGLVAVALLGVAVAMAAEPQSEIGSGGDSTSRDIDVWVPFDLGLWAAPQGSVPGGRHGSRGYTFRGSRRGGAGGGNLTGLLKSRRLREALELTELLRSDNPPRAQVEQKIREITQLQGDLMRTRVDALLSARAVLTPEQQQKAQELRSQWRGGRRGMWRGGGQSRGSSREHFRRGWSGQQFRRYFDRPTRPPTPPRPPSPPTPRDGF